MSRAAACPDCGLELDTISPLDAVRAVRSFPRRYRALLTGFDDRENGDALVRRRPDPSTPSALERAAAVADLLDASAPMIRRTTVEDQPTLAHFDAQRRDAERAANERSLREVLDEIDTACADLAATIEMVDDDDWSRVAHLDSGDRTSLEMARDAVHEGSHTLRDVEEGLRQVRGRPSADSDW